MINSIKKSGTGILGVLAIALSLTLMTACQKDKDPTISQLKICSSLSGSDKLCSSHNSTLPKTAPRIIMSGVFDNIDEDTPVKFTFFKKQSDGSLTRITDTTIRGSDAGDFGDATRFEINAFITLPDGRTWSTGEIEIKAEIQDDITVSQSQTTTIVD